MNLKSFEKRLRTYKEQKYNMLLTKQSLIETGMNNDRQLQLMKAVDEAIIVIDNAILATERIIDYLKGIESEINGYLILRKKLEDIMFDQRLDAASTRMTANKLNSVGEHLQHLEQLLKYKQ